MYIICIQYNISKHVTESSVLMKLWRKCYANAAQNICAETKQTDGITKGSIKLKRWTNHSHLLPRIQFSFNHNSQYLHSRYSMLPYAIRSTTTKSDPRPIPVRFDTDTPAEIRSTSQLNASTPTQRVYKNQNQNQNNRSVEEAKPVGE